MRSNRDTYAADANTSRNSKRTSCDTGAAFAVGADGKRAEFLFSEPERISRGQHVGRCK